MILTSFQVKNKLEKVQFFQDNFLVSNIGIKVILNIYFLIFNNIDKLFVKKKVI